MYDVTKLSDTTEGEVRRASFATCDLVCSKQIDIEIEGDIINGIHFTVGFHGNTQGVSILCKGMKVADVIARLEGIDCKGRGTSCPDQLAKALRQLSE